MKAAIVILTIACLGLGVALLVRHNKAVEVQQETENRITTLSNRLEDARTKLDEQERLSMFLQTNLNLRSQELLSVSNQFASVTRELSKTKTEAQAAAEAAQVEMAKRDAKINELEAQKTALDKQAGNLKGAIDNLEKSIAETETKLAASEGDREFLLKELKRLQTEKADLERQFNDLAALRTQVSRLKEDLSVARRLDWIRQGIYGSQTRKGAELLMSGVVPPGPGTNFDLNVELRQDGSATVIPPKGTNTNTQPAPTR